MIKKGRIQNAMILVEGAMSTLTEGQEFMGKIEMAEAACRDLTKAYNVLKEVSDGMEDDE